MRRDELLESLRGLVARDIHPVANLANAAALLWQEMNNINWVGFYLLDGGALWLGPFCGKPACTRIAVGRGVCGTALARNETLLVPDVHAFPGHIACDAASRSELVVPLRREGRAVGVLDIDSPLPGRFTEGDRLLMEAAAEILQASVDFDHLHYDLRNAEKEPT